MRFFPATPPWLTPVNACSHELSLDPLASVNTHFFEFCTARCRRTCVREMRAYRSTSRLSDVCMRSRMTLRCAPRPNFISFILRREYWTNRSDVIHGTTSSTLNGPADFSRTGSLDPSPHTSSTSRSESEVRTDSSNAHPVGRWQETPK